MSLPLVALFAAQPFVEWVIHKYLLHLPPLTLLGRRVELYGSIQHRNHHRSPSDLDRVLLKPVEVVSFAVQIAVLVPLLTWALVAALGGGHVVALSLTALTVAYLGLFRYEWSHFLIHTPYVPKSALVPRDLAQPSPAPLQARGLLDGRELEPRRSHPGDQPRPAHRAKVADRANPRRRHRVGPFRRRAAAGRVRAVTFVLLTGATRGIGRAAAVALAGQGVELALVGREPERVRAVAAEAVATGGGAPVHEHVADLALMSEVRALAEEVREQYAHIDVLANNAGALFASRKETPEGFEQTFALNHLAPFLLTNLLLDRLDGGRVVTTASDAHKSGRLHHRRPAVRGLLRRHACLRHVETVQHPLHPGAGPA